MSLTAADRDVLIDLAPLLRRAVDLDPRGLARLRGDGARVGVFVRLPFGVLVSRAVDGDRTGPLDVTVAATDALAWLDADGPLPPSRDADWRAGLPPARGWTRVETVPDSVIRPLVRQGALALKQTAEREGVPGAQPRAEVADALLDAVVLTVRSDAGERAEVALRALSALTRMGFLRKDGVAHVDVCGRWLRVVGEYGTVYSETPGGLHLV